MKKHLSIFILLLAILSFTGCSSGTKEDTPEIPPQIIISEDILTDGLSFTHEGGEKSVNFSSKQDWTLTVNNGDNWCIPSKTEGTTGVASVSFKISKNEKPEKRKATATIQAGSASKTFTIVQDELVPEITIDERLIENGVSFTNEGGEITIDFSTNVDWELIIEDKEQWCIPSQTSGTAGQASVLFKISKNEIINKRKTSVTIQAGSANKTFTIIQDELIPEIVIDKQLIENGIYVSNQENSFLINFSVNTYWRITKGNQEWCIPSCNSGEAGNFDITFSIAANDTYNDRQAEITIEATYLRKRINIIQEKKYILAANAEHYTKKYTAGNVLVSFKCNTDFDISINAQWLKLISLEKDSTYNHKLLLEVEENKGKNDRTASITIVNKEKDLKQIITITQKGNSEDEGISPDGNIDNMEWE